MRTWHLAQSFARQVAPEARHGSWQRSSATSSRTPAVHQARSPLEGWCSFRDQCYVLSSVGRQHRIPNKQTKPKDFALGLSCKIWFCNFLA